MTSVHTIMSPSVIVRLTKDDAEIRAAQRLRYEVFYEEYGAKADPAMQAERLDVDQYDAHAKHLIVIDESHSPPRIVGTYRLLMQDAAERAGQFYSSQEYDLTPLLTSGGRLLELGRSCVLPAYRTRPILQLLWQGIADYVSDHNIDLLFGCASLHGTNIEENARQLSYLYHYHRAPEDLRPRALESRFIDMNIIPKDRLNVKKAFAELPPLVKGYLRVGASIGEGAVIDEQFNTTDICIMMHTSLIDSRYRRHYERKIQKAVPGGERVHNGPESNAGEIAVMARKQA